MRFPVLIIIIVFCVVFKMVVNRKPKRDPDAEFLELERQANLTPKKDISHLPYIHVPADSLPLDVPTDREEVKERQDIIRSMADRQILNLTGRTNTELKLEYGAPNINTLTAADNNFTKLVQSLSFLSSDYMDLGCRDEARQLLEYGIGIGADSKKMYTLLASIYMEEGRPEKIDELVNSAMELDSIIKDGIVRSLREIASKTS